MSTSVSLEEAQRLLLERAVPLKTENVGLQKAVGRVLAEDLTAGEDIPGFNRSLMDGYAVRAVDTAAARSEAPVILPVIGEVAAGYLPSKPLAPQTAMKVMTGAPLPAGADAVIKFEDAGRQGDSINVISPVRTRCNIILAGGDLACGDIVARRYTVVTPAHIGVLSLLGFRKLMVFTRPRAAVFCTGDELVDLYEPVGLGKIRNSNLYSICAYVDDAGGRALPLQNAPDDQNIIAQRILKGLAEADMVITTGGSSKGDYDLVKEALLSLGAEPVFNGVEMRPGATTAAFAKDKKLIIVLSGNPAANLAAFLLLVSPAIKKMSGNHCFLPPAICVSLGEPISKRNRQREFLRGRLVLKDKQLTVMLSGVQDASMIKSMVGCNVLVDLPAGSGPVAAGADVSAYLIGRVNDLDE